MPIRTGPPAPLSVDVRIPETVGYRLKKRLLGPPLVTSRLRGEKLSNPTALGVLASDCISSSAYGTEQMLRALVPYVGTAAFTLLLPVTYAILAVLLLLTLSYWDVVSLYTKAGGSYIVARDNFGPRVAQVASVALLIDYIVTVAVQTAAGTDAIASLLHLVWGTSISGWKPELCVGVVAVLFYGNLRGVKEAGRAFALPAYLFMGAMAIVFAVAVIRWAIDGSLPHADVHAAGAVPLGPSGNGLLYGASLFVVLRAFANGGSSLTGLEALSNSVSSFREPQGDNARKTLVAMSLVLAILVLGISLLAHITHAIPFTDGDPTVIAQEAHLILGGGVFGRAGLIFVQLATALILYTGANTPFNGFPFLVDFVAEDAFLPRMLRKRGHRLAFSNGIILLAVPAVALLLVTQASVDSLVALYAIGVFTGFTMAGAGLTKHHWTRRTRRWQVGCTINALAAFVSGAVVLIFAITKFTEGAWLVVVLFPLGVWALIGVNRRYREEVAALAEAPATAEFGVRDRSVVVVLVDSLDVAVLQAVRYGRSLGADDLHAVHFELDNRRAKRLQARWEASRAADIPLELVECPDRRLARAVLELAAREVADGASGVTLLLPTRTYPPVIGRLLHGRTTDEIASAVTRVPHAVATIVPFDVGAAMAHRRHVLGSADEPPAKCVPRLLPTLDNEPEAAGGTPASAHATIPVGSVAALKWRRRAEVVGRIRAVSPSAETAAPRLEVELYDSTGGLKLLFHGRRNVAGLEPGRRLRVRGIVGESEGHLAMSDPTYDLLPEDDDEGPNGDEG
ncbi:amino acid permease [Streptomyces sp. SID3343]|nr:amino acid permease [Streptomyces sp. SID3343]